MRHFLLLLLIVLSLPVFAQQDSTAVYKKRVLESSEVEFLSSYYTQDGAHSAVGGGIGTEDLQDYTANVVLSVPMNADDVLTIDAGFSAYTSASSSNINPFQGGGVGGSTGASRHAAPNSRRDDDDGDDNGNGQRAPYGTPWAASTGASRKDVLVSLNGSYAHSSNDRNTIVTGHASVSKEYDYQSFGIGGGIVKLFNHKNTEVGLSGNVYLDKWFPIYPTELKEYAQYGAAFQQNGYFDGVTVYNQNGQADDAYLPLAFHEFGRTNRNSYSMSLSFAQTVNKRLQFSLFAELVYQEGLLSTPYHRIYFADRANYYIGEIKYIPLYSTDSNAGIFRLADDIERLPGTRLKVPVGGRLNYYINDRLVVRSYYRYYKDDWALEAHTASVELPYKFAGRFTFTPMYRFYTQKAARYFAPFEKQYSFMQYYTADYDLSAFDSHQFGAGIGYYDVLNRNKLLSFGLKNIDLRYNHYERSDNLQADIVTLSFKFVQ